MIKAMILSAGLGTRLRPVTIHLPKPAIPFMGIPIALYSIEYALQAGAEEFVFNTHYLPEKLINTLSPYLDKLGMRYHFVHEDEKILGSGGGLKNAQKYLYDAEAIIVCNGDEIIFPENIYTFSKLTQQHLENKNTASLLCMEHPEAGKGFGGVWTKNKNEIIGFGRKKISGSTDVLHYTGFSVYSPEIFDYLPQGESNILYDGIVSALGDNKKAVAENHKLWWQETGNQKDFISAHDSIFSNWNSEYNNIMFSALNRFLDSPLRDQLLSNKNPQGNLGYNGNNSAKNWNINLNPKFDPQDLNQYSKCIILPTHTADNKAKDSQICC